MVRIPAVALSLLLATTALTGCALFDDIGGSDLDDALELVPGEAASVRFIHREATAERLGIDDIARGASRKDTRRYLEALLDDGATGSTQFASYLEHMARHAAFSEVDVVWEVTSAGGDDTARAYKLDEDLDLDDVGDDLADAGYAEDQLSGHRHLFIADVATDTEFDGTIGAYPGTEMPHVVLVPDEHLMFVGRSAAAVEESVDIFEDDEDSATDAGTFDDVLDEADDPEYALLVKGPECADPGEQGSPEATGVFISGDEAAATTVLAFADDEMVTTDYEPDEREAALDAADCEDG